MQKGQPKEKSAAETKFERLLAIRGVAFVSCMEGDLLLRYTISADMEINKPGITKLADITSYVERMMTKAESEKMLYGGIRSTRIIYG